MKLIQDTIVAVAILASGIAVALNVGAAPSDPRIENGQQAVTHAKPLDPVGDHLLPAVRKTYRATFPGHQVWKVMRTGKGEAARHELIIFDPSDNAVTSGMEGPVFFSKRRTYNLILGGSGEIIREQGHPIAEEDVPEPVRRAFETWRNPSLPDGPYVVWLVQKEEGSERLYFVRVHLDLIALESASEYYGATLKADGTIVKRFTHLKRDHRTPSDK